MTRPLGTALQEIGAASDSRRLPPPADVRTLGDRRRRRTALGVVGAAALAGSVLVLVLLPSTVRQAQPVDPLRLPTGTVQPDRQLGGPSSYPIGTGEHRFGARAVAAHDGRFVVVGDSSDVEHPGPPVYWSDDGMHWRAPRPAREPDSINVTDVIATPQGFLAVGVRRDSGTAAWRSADGRSWTGSQVATTGEGGSLALWGITSTRLGYFAWGFEGRRTHLWRSADGLAWALVADDSAFDLPRRVAICAVTDVHGGLRATGAVAPAGTNEADRVAWTSPDGESWVRDDSARGATFWCDPTKELDHWQARTDAGLVRIEPYGSGDSVELVPPED